MERPTRFEHNRWVGDKRDQRVHDLDHCEPEPFGEGRDEEDVRPPIDRNHVLLVAPYFDRIAAQ